MTILEIERRDSVSVYAGKNHGASFAAG